MLKWLREAFGSKPITIKMADDRPEWTIGDAIGARAFFSTVPGQKMLARMRWEVTNRCMNVDGLTMEELALVQAFACVVEGHERLADVDYWKAQLGVVTDDED